MIDYNDIASNMGPKIWVGWVSKSAEPLSTRIEEWLKDEGESKAFVASDSDTEWVFVAEKELTYSPPVGNYRSKGTWVENPAYKEVKEGEKK